MSIEAQIEKLIDRDPSITDENANKDSRVIGTMRDLLAGVASKEYVKGHGLPPEVAEAHESGEIHVHDLDYSIGGYFNCSVPDIPYMLANGFQMGGATIESPKSLRTAAEVIPQIVVNIASNQYGGLTVHEIDKILEPYAELSMEKYRDEARKWVSEDRVEEYARAQMVKEVYDACQGLEYEANSCFSSSGQQPFLTFSFGLSETWIGREIQKAILKVRLKGLGKDGITPVFPKLIYILKDGHNLRPDDPQYDIKQLALECSSKRIYPDLLAYDKVVEIYGTFVTPMGCRSFIPYHEKADGVPMVYGRRNGGVVSLNLPRQAMKSLSKADFFENVAQQAENVRKALEWRIDTLRGVQAKNNPIFYMSGACGHVLEPDDYVIGIFKHGEATFSFGYTGLNEAVAAFYGEEWYYNEEAVAFSLEIMSFLNGIKDSWNDDSEFLYTLYATPAESLTDRFARIDQEAFGVTEYLYDKGWYTNSFHMDPRHKTDPFTKYDFEKVYPPLSTGGNIVYVEMPSLVDNLEALETLWDYAYERVPYFGVNTPVSKCRACGYEGDMDADAKGYYCVSCGNRDEKTLEVIIRLCGYLSDASARKPISGRVKEIQSRVKHGAP